MLLNDEDTEQKSDNYPVEADTEFTLDEIEAIQNYKEQLSKKLNKNRSVLKGLEVGFWSITSYSIARFLVLTSGTSGVGLAIAASFLINNIVNRDCLDSFNFDRKNGEFEVIGMGKLVKFGFSTLVASFVIWNATGDLLRMVDNSKSTYDALQNQVEEFNKLPDNQQRNIFIVGGIVGLAGVYVIVDSLRTRR
ncbi:MAG: hypothetical protein HC836_10340 [Richelia sp. RM2_1_2]|nr:hypothetical protein [Richelia sp. SM1_7_0]NJN13264.1 hypothetical protein [Richelia sp. RM1_1_1]NJO26883.1 hypothetical protein [Richelia sp. SL_2_1]NJO58722.1 hypothetical protein [Richelia sp. RM2_1_2]